MDRKAVLIVPVLQGPLVGERQSSHAITTEYANADPVYRAKTAVSYTGHSLSKTYSDFKAGSAVQILPLANL